MTAAPDLGRLADYVRHWAATTPDAPAWAYQDQLATYRDLQDQVERTAKALLAAGVRRGDRIAMLTTPRPEYWQTFLACAAIGAVWVGLNPRHQVRELEHVVRDSRPALLLALDLPDRPELFGVLRDLAERHAVRAVVVFGADPGQWDGFLAQGDGVDDEVLHGSMDAVTPDDPALIVYTSGSTGAPKGAVLGHRGLCACFRIQAAHQTVTALRVIANLPVNHIGGVGDLCCTPLVTGGLIVFQERFDPDDVFTAIERHGVTALMQVPTTLKMLAEHPRFGVADLSSIEAVHWGGGPLPSRVIGVWRGIANRLGVTYGMTEITGSITYSDPEATDEELAHTVGRPISEVQLRLSSGTGEDVGIETEGEVQVRHPGQMLEYFGNPGATAAALTDDGYFRTGDVAVRRADGNLVLVGRLTEMYKSGGYNVYPREIELTLESHPDVRMAAVVAVADPVFDEVGYAFVEADDRLEAAVLREWCSTLLANYKVPKVFEVVPRLPLLPVGKVDKKLLQRTAAGRYPAAPEEPRD